MRIVDCLHRNSRLTYYKMPCFCVKMVVKRICFDDVNDKEMCYIMSMLFEFEIEHGMMTNV